jgi:hypothetical protein
MEKSDPLRPMPGSEIEAQEQIADAIKELTKEVFQVRLQLQQVVMALNRPRM